MLRPNKIQAFKKSQHNANTQDQNQNMPVKRTKAYQRKKRPIHNIGKRAAVKEQELF